MSDPRAQRKINPALLLSKAAAKENNDRGLETGEFSPAPSRVLKKQTTISPSRVNATPVAPQTGATRNGERQVRDSFTVPDKRQAKPVESPAAPETTVTPERPRRAMNPRFAIEEEAEAPAPRRTAPVRPTQPAEENKAEQPRRRVMNPKFVVDEETETKPRNVTRAAATAPDNTPRAFPTRSVNPSFQRPGARRVQQNYVPSKRKAEAAINSEEWTEDESSDTGYGLGGEKETNRRKARYDKAIRLSDRDIIVIKFLARYRYAYTEQIARLLDTTPSSVSQRLRKLEQNGLLKKQHITDRQYLWMTSKAGNLVVDISFPEIKKGAVSYATIAHTIGLANLGVELEREAGGKDILGERDQDNEDEEPAKNRYKLGIWGHEAGKGYGEMTVSEREIRQGQLRWRGGRSTLEMRELVDLALAAPVNTEPQELLEGNEGLFVVYGADGHEGEHIPDLVVARERGPEGEARHIAIELELTEKQLYDWRRILRWYRNNGVMYDKIYYFTHKRSIAYALRRADEEVGLGDRLVIRKYTPVNGRIPFWG
jgi:DNA-binding transcriptional ArsR family regulator